MDRVGLLRGLLALAECQLRALASEDIAAAQTAMADRAALMAQWDGAPGPRTEEELRQAQALAAQLLDADRKLEAQLGSALRDAGAGLEQLRSARKTFRAYSKQPSLPSRFLDRRG